MGASPTNWRMVIWALPLTLVTAADETAALPNMIAVIREIRRRAVFMNSPSRFPAPPRDRRTPEGRLIVLYSQVGPKFPGRGGCRLLRQVRPVRRPAATTQFGRHGGRPLPRHGLLWGAA